MDRQNQRTSQPIPGDSWFPADSAQDTMIGPASAFYDPDNQQQQQQQQANYQQWIDNYPPQQQSGAYRQQQQPQQQYSDYQYNISQYPQQQSNAPNPTAPPYAAPDDMFSSFFSSDMIPIAPTSASSDEQPHSYHSSPHSSSVHSYNNTPDPSFPPTHNQPPFNPPPQQQQQSRTQSRPIHAQFQQQPQPAQGPPSHTHQRFIARPAPRQERVSQQNTLPYITGQSAFSFTSSSSATPGPGPASQKAALSHLHDSASAGPSAYSKARGPTPTKPSSAKRKRTKKDEDSGDWGHFQDSDEDSDDDDDGLGQTGAIGVGLGGLGVIGKGGKRDKGTRLPGACTHCKKLKMKCDFPRNENTCKRCRSSGHVCIVEGRRPRTAPNKREYLLAQIRQKDNIIESLLKQLHNPYVATPLSIASYRMATSPSDQNNTNVLAWLERLQASVRDGPKTGSSSVAGGPSSGAHVGSGLRHTAAANSSFPINTNFGELRSASETIDDEESDNETTADRRTQRGRGGGGGGGLVPVTSTVGIRATVGSDVVSRSSSLGGGVGPSGGSSTADTTTTPADDPEDESAADKMSRLPTHVPLGLIADLSLSNNKAANRRGGNKDPTITEAELDDDNVGVANETYFMPGPATDLGIRATLIEQHSPPEIIVHGLVKPEDVEKLFQIFYEKVNPFISILDPVLHTPASTFSRCPFLFTVICAISSRYYVDKSEIYPIAMHFAKHSAANALIDGWKSVELCQAYILMSIYAVPARRWEEDRSWLYTGLAIRIATDLNLHHAAMLKPTSERHEREILNKIRVWMICFNLDRSTATQFGKPSTIKEDFIIRDCKDWYKKSQYNIAHDIHLCAYSAMLQIVASFHEEVFSDPSAPTGLNKKVDFRAVTLIHDGHLTEYHKEWQKRFDEESDPNDPSCVFRCSLLPFLVGYSRLVMYSFGFQQAFIRGFEASDRLFLTTCFSSAKSVIENMIDGLAPSGYMRYAPDGHFIFASFASAFLLKLLRPEFSSIIDKEMENEIFDLIGRLIQTLSSPRIAIDDRHTPKLYARFLAGLLSRHRRDGATVGRLQTNPQGPSGGIAGSGPGGGAGGSSGMSTFSISGAGGGGKAGDASSYGGQNPGGMSQALDTPVYVPEATFAGGGGAIHLASDYDIAYGGTGVSDEEMLATMQAIKNPAWWSNMMMPGFSWPEASPSPSGSVHSVPPPSYQAAVGMDGIQSFGMYPSQVMM